MFGRLFQKRAISRIAVSAAAPLPGRQGLAIALIVRNEERHIGEWVRFHLAAGVRAVFAYDNGSTDNTVQVLQDCGGDRVTVTPWQQKLHDAATGREIHNQVLAYAHAITNFGGTFRWMAAIDADEFLVPKTAASLDGALGHLGAEVGAVTLPWHNFGRNGHTVAPAGGVLENYTQRASDPMSGARGVTNFKTIVDPARVTAVKVHSCEIDGQAQTWNDTGRHGTNAGRRARGFYSAAHVQLNHYYTRSEAELAAKIERGSNQRVEATRHAARVRRNVENIEADQVEDRCALDFLARIGRETPL